MGMKLVAHFDGACEPMNPGGNMGIGAFIVDPNTGEMLMEHSSFVKMKWSNSNNVAEYMAFIRILEWLIEKNHHENDALHIDIFGDSKLVVEQMSGRWRMKAGRYIDHAKRSQQLLAMFRGKINIRWVPRDQNGRADELSKSSLEKNNVTFKIQPK